MLYNLYKCCTIVRYTHNIMLFNMISVEFPTLQIIPEVSPTYFSVNQNFAKLHKIFDKNNFRDNTK